MKKYFQPKKLEIIIKVKDNKNMIVNVIYLQLRKIILKYCFKCF